MAPLSLSHVHRKSLRIGPYHLNTKMIGLYNPIAGNSKTFQSHSHFLQTFKDLNFFLIFYKLLKTFKNPHEPCRCNAHSNFLSKFCERMHMSSCINFMSHSISHVHSCNGIYSLIDHFAISSDVVSYDVCKHFYVCDDCIVNNVNLSDHDPICFSYHCLSIIRFFCLLSMTLYPDRRLTGIRLILMT